MLPIFGSQIVASLLDASVDGILCFDHECRYTAWNAAMERISGLKREAVLGRCAFDVFPFLKESGEDRYFQLALSGSSAVVEARPYTVPETERSGFFAGHYSPLRNESGEIVGGVAVIRDITRDTTERNQIADTLRATEQRFMMFMENLPGLAWIKDTEGQYVYVNEAAVQAFRRPRNQLIGKTDDDIFTAETAAKFRENDKLAISSGAGILAIEALQQSDGVHHSIVSKFPIHDGDATMVCGIAIDITEHMRAEEALRESDEKYRSLLENANDIIYSHDLEGNYLTINRACEVVTGYTREEILGGLNIAEVVVPEHLELARRMMEVKLRDPSPTVYDIDILTKDGRRLTLEVSTRVSQRDGSRPIIEGVARDVTERKRSEAEREELLGREHEARLAAEQALSVARSIEESLSLLVEASGVLLGTLTLEDVQPAILDLSQRLISADAYAIWRSDPRTKTWSIVSSAGLSEDYRLRSIENWPEDYVLTKPVIAEQIDGMPLLEARRQMYQSEGIRSLLAVPVRIHGESNGTLTYYYRQPHQFSDKELRVATALANLASAAISSAELYDEQRELRAKAQASEWRSNFLAEASNVLSSTLNYEATLARVARLAVPDLADWCAVDISDGHGSLKRLAVAHVDPAKVAWAHEIQERYPPDINATRGVSQVLRSCQSEIYSQITDEMLVEAARDEEHLRLLRAVGLSSAMLIPLLAHGRAHGVITFITAESGRRYGPEDLLLAEDLARRAAVAVENARLYELAQNANRLKDEFLATVSHELRTPLTAILGWASMLRTNRLDEEGLQRALETIERNARNQQQIIEDLLDVSRIITGKLRLEIRPVEIASLIAASVDSFNPAAAAKAVSLEQRLDPQLGSVELDPARIQQIVWNLLSNAIKFTPPGGSVKIVLERVDSELVIAISDTGQGITAEFLPFVFDRFRQADSTTTRKHGGLGLGLAIVRNLVELHGGSVRADSAGEGCGSTFIVRLPLRRIDQRIDIQQKILSADGGQVAQFESEENLNGLKVLIVDDEADTCELLKAVLERCHAHVETAQSVREALEKLPVFLPDILISDIGMPDEDGYDLIRRVRRLPRERGGDVPAVALTAYATINDRLRVLREGYQMHIPKPLELAELVTVVTSLARRKLEARGDES